MKVVLAQSAMANLIAIGRYIARDSPARAATFVDELEQKCLELADAPFAFPLLPHRKNKDVRPSRGCSRTSDLLTAQSTLA